MRNVPPDKYNVAWFKLAECVSRGEKERALGVYRLLAHSLHDPAFARQLQGDLFLSFNDLAGALEQYTTAAQLYKQDNRLLEVAAIYEHLVVLTDAKQAYHAVLVDIYTQLHNQVQAIAHATILSSLLVAQGNSDEAMRIIDQLDGVFGAQETIALRQHIIIEILAVSIDTTPTLILHIDKIIACLLQSKDTTALQRFVSKVEAVNNSCYKHVCDYIAQAQ